MSTFALAIGPGGGKGDCYGMGKHRGERFEQVLNLSDQQKAEVSQIREQYRSQMRAIRSGVQRPKLHSLDPNDPNYVNQVEDMAQARAKIAEQEFRLRAEKHAKIYAILDESQREQLKQFWEQRKNQRRPHDEMY